ncbi:CDP-glycerol glycerophosphotransferase family protein [Nocardioides donggukensis]|uniref:CDP-glycerol glycerophosphotransferase family protein n=1 Tax=Nocardioides donggukensis TaxID=2774019 RepID=A0A927Q3S8_9ACTN|nr:CDP-glycerol glycerophosphotransferase family protein [Nocardioides donggukensis]MBD8870871.1 CDP-glycerol glycerophosphotransferase family protein [Nocardioides donggukensis]
MWHRVRRALRRRRTSVAVVVTVGPRQSRHLADCLGSLADQHRPPEETWLCGWSGEGLPDGLPALQGLRVAPPEESGNAARNRGRASTRCDAVLFLEASQTLRPDALSRLTGELAPDVSWVGGAGPDLGERLWRRDRAPVFDPAHGRFPQAALTRRRGGPGSGREVRLADSVSDGAERTWSVPFGTVPPAAPEAGHLAAVLEAGVAPARVADPLEAVLDDLEHAGAADVDRLAAVAAALTPAALSGLPVETRLRLWLVGQGERDAMSRLTVDRWFERGSFPTRAGSGTVRARLEVPGVEPPPWLLEVRPTLRLSLRRVRRTEDALVATVYAVVPEVDYAESPPDFTAHLVDATGDRPAVELPVTVRPDPEVTRFAGRAHQSHDTGCLEVALAPLPAGPGGRGRWRLEVGVQVAGLELSGRVTERDARGSAGLLGAPDLAGGGAVRFDGTDGLTVGSAGEATEDAAVSPDPPAAEQVEVVDGRLLVRGPARGAFTAALCLAGLRVPAEVEVHGGRFTAAVPLRREAWGTGPCALPTGTWHLAWQGDDETSGGDLSIAPSLAALTPLDTVHADHRVRFRRGLRDQLLVELAAPLADDELGPRAQHRLRSAYAAVESPTDPGLVLFSSYAGTGATDSPRAIHDELRARHPGLRTLWTVADHAVPVPEGARPVLLRSRAWYDALARAGTVVSNVEVDRFYRTRPDQRLVQTFHGYPSKSMGLALWRSKNHSPLRLRRQLADTAGTWTVALTPTPEMDRHYREQYAFEGTILNHGYPRDDALVGPGAAHLRQRARAALGLAEDDVAVLYAPTWRDDLATNFRAAPLVTHLDVERLAERLGPGHVVLLRGHRFHRPPGSSARTIDVSSHPEINELILAADAAVLDYSSLRFDAAVTGLPMVFLVPDLADYAGTSRGFLFPFEESAPGPLLATTDEVAAALEDLAALREGWSGEMAAFNERFNRFHDGRAAARVVTALWGPGEPGEPR